MSILTEADSLINGDRQEDYDHPAINFANIAQGWEVILGCPVPVTPEQVALCMIWVKVCRETHRHTRDNIVDLAGYAGTIELIKEFHKDNPETKVSGRLPWCQDAERGPCECNN